jgi:integrase
MIKFNSPFKEKFLQFIKTKALTSSNCQGRYWKYLKDFDSYVVQQGFNQSVLTELLVMGWYPQRPNESLNLWQHRLVPLRRFGIWDLSKGNECFKVPGTGTTVWKGPSTLSGPFASRIRMFLSTFTKKTRKVYKYFTSLAYFDNYCKDIINDNSNIQLTKNLVEGWYKTILNNSEKTILSRMYALRLFAYWLIEQGEFAYINCNSTKTKRNKKRIFKSCFACKLKDFIKFKQNSGYIYKSSITILHNFDNFCVTNNFNDKTITKKIMDLWSKKRSTENYKSQLDRIQKVNVFSKHLRSLGYDSYVLAFNQSKNKALVHVLSDEEMISIYKQIDIIKNNKPWLNYTYPVILRLIYFCGLRISEACNVQVQDFDCENNKLTIKGGKNNRDRELLLSDDVIHLLKVYDKKLSRYFPTRLWFFTGENILRHVTAQSVRIKFNLAWNKTPFNKKVEKKPTVHCLRHTYIVNTIRRWMEENKDVNTLYPYLSKYLGHKSIKGTQYYFQFLSCHYPMVLKKLEFTNFIIPEVYHEKI